MRTAFLARLLGLPLLILAVPALAATRTLTLAAPATAKPGAALRVSIAAATDQADAEHVGFLHAETSADGGKSWQPVFYGEKLGRAVKQAVELKAGAAGTRLLVRARAAFRGGKAGDVDFAGQPVDWDGSWGKWQSPPARLVTIAVTPR